MTDQDPTPLRDQYQRLLARIEANEAEFRRLGRAVWRVQEDERRRLARELHDGIGQNLTALKHRLALLGSELPPGADAARQKLDAAIALCSATLDDTRKLSRLLRPPMLDDLGLEPSLRWLVRSLGEGDGPGIDAEIDPLPELDGEVQTLLFRISQEALSNAIRHAQARHITLRLRMDGRFADLEIADDGIGCDPAVAMRSGGSGLGGMRERIRLHGGRFELHSEPGAGTRVRARVPLDAT